jgi:hypothetical protein
MALGNFPHPFDNIKKNKEEISNISLKMLYKVWKQRSETATTSPSAGIKWKKTKASISLPQTKNNDSVFNTILNILEMNHSHTNKNIFSTSTTSLF